MTTLLFAVFSLAATGSAFAAGGAVKIVSYYDIVLNAFGLSKEDAALWKPVAGALFILAILLFVGFMYRSHINNKLAAGDLVPDGEFSLRSVIDGLMDVVYGLATDIIGSEAGKRYVGLLGSLFFFIFFCNVSGLVPGFTPATENIDTNLAIGLIVFVSYNLAGIRAHGLSYVKQFIGPIGLLAPLMIIIELISHAARPLSLSLRLYGNIFGDHLVLSVFTGLTYLVLPSMLLFFGLLVASLQSFVFTLLSGIYIGVGGISRSLISLLVGVG